MRQTIIWAIAGVLFAVAVYSCVLMGMGYVRSVWGANLEELNGYTWTDSE